MHERTKRAVARLLFVLCCALPTMFTALAVAITFTPWFGDYRRVRIQNELSLRIGLAVEVGKVEYPAPATVRLSDVRLLEPETHAEVAKVRVVTWVLGDDKTAVVLSQPEFHSAKLPLAWRAIHDRFFCQPDLTALPIRMAANDVTIHSRTGSMSLPDFDTWLRPVSTGVDGVNQIVPADRSESANIHISVKRDRSGDVPFTECTMMTGDVPMNCSALADCLPSLKRLGADATFTGMMRWRVQAEEWSIDLGAARFANVELGELSLGLRHRITGNAVIDLERCQIRPGKSLDLSGTLIGDSGFVSPSLLAALKQELKFDINPTIAADSRDQSYDHLAIRFDFFGSDMTLSGICNKNAGLERLPPGIVLANGGVALLASGPPQQTWVGLARSLWPERSASLPVSTQTAWLFGIMPAPQPSHAEFEEIRPEPPRVTSLGDFQGTPTITQPRQ